MSEMSKSRAVVSRPLNGRVALVTGAARGIGAAVMHELARAGAVVAGCDLEAPGADSNGAFYDCDVTSAPAVAETISAVETVLGPVDILVNNAGILRVAQLTETSEEDWLAVIATNLTGVFLCTRAVMGGMVERGFGRIISLASITALRGEPRTVAYAASKGGVIGFTRSLAREVAHRGVTVNAVAPGYVETEQTREAFQGTVRDSVLSQIPMRRLAEPGDIVGTVAFLASEQAAYLTGQVITIDGGVT